MSIHYSCLEFFFHCYNAIIFLAHQLCCVNNVQTAVYSSYLSNKTFLYYSETGLKESDISRNTVKDEYFRYVNHDP